MEMESIFKHLRMKILLINLAAYSNIDLPNIHCMYGRANGNCRKAQRLYQQIFPQRQCSAKNIFSLVHRRLRETGYKTFTTCKGSVSEPVL